MNQINNKLVKDTPDKKVGKLFIVFAGLCMIALPFIVYAALSGKPEQMEISVIETQNIAFDQNGNTIFESYDQISKEYLEGTSTERTLEKYYSLRQYPGSPPYVPHKVEETDGTQTDNTRLECLTCHAKGGWTDELKANTPVTPHPEYVSCKQCHVRMTTDNLFVKNNWLSVQLPLLGRSHLPGGPPPIAHDLQMRGNCIACHVGPGTVSSVRVDHPSRGNCRQCHVPDSHPGLFQRESVF
jgi:cytochrome c-type protein NapB